MEQAARLLAEVAGNGKRIYCCGNGGSAAISNHLVCDCMKGIRIDSTLRPQVVFAGEHMPTPQQLAQLHEQAHGSCFIANSVRTEVRCEPRT